ncbi:MAG: M20/M25/M40 family metallo-hydrolase [bacterium]
MKRTMRAFAVLVAALGLIAVYQGPVAQETVYLDVVEQIRDEGLNRSRVPEDLHYLTDVIGPRLTGSPAFMRAAEWAMDRFREYGLENVHLESWGPFGRGWEEIDTHGRMVEPFARPLIARPGAWTAGTDGLKRGPAVYVPVESEEDLEGLAEKVDGAWVLMSDASDLRRKDDRPPRLVADADDLLQPARERVRRERPQIDPEERERLMEERRARRELANRTREVIQESGALGLLRRSSLSLSALRPAGSGSREAGAPHGLPDITLANEDYSLIFRNAASGIPVVLEFDVQTRFHEDDLNGYNVIGEIPGTDRADEFIVLGNHLDSWHLGTGATDNGAGSVIMMEAMRILKALDLEPRRTIRIGLWGGEEQGLFGSRAYVEDHADELDRISAYLNLDNGTGKVRGIWTQNNAGVIPVFEQLLWPMRDLGVVAVRHGNTGSTDHVAFDAAGVPGFNFIQDPQEYGTTYHSNLDTYEALALEDLEQAATVTAILAYHLAMRDEMLPRKPEEEADPRRP